MKNIFVGNLDFGATEESVRALFEPYGTVDRVSLITDRDTGRSRGFAFVEMSDAGQAERAIAGLNGAQYGWTRTERERSPAQDRGRRGRRGRQAIRRRRRTRTRRLPQRIPLVGNPAGR